MDGDENSFRFSSNLPRPNRANSQTRNLQDITATANNASRSMLPPPGSIAGSVARKQPESSEPPSKRKTLMERAGEPRQTHRPGHGSSKSFSASVNSFNTNPAYASSASSRNPSASSRTTSRGSNSSHKGSGMRPPSARGIARPKTAIGCPLGQPASRLRPATAMDGHDDDDEQDSILGKRKGTDIFFRSSIQSTKPTHQGSDDNQVNRDQNWSSSVSHIPVCTNNFRDFSISTAMQRLSLNAGSSCNGPPSKELPPPQVPSTPNFSKPLRISRPMSTTSPSPSLAKGGKKYIKKKTPAKKSPFLTRDSSVQAWDQDAKMEDMNAMFRKFVDQLQGTSSHSESMKEALDLYKSRIETLETKLAETTDHNIKLRVDLDTTKAELSRAEASITELAREHEISADDVDRKHRVEAESIRQEAHRQIDVITQKHEGEIRELRRRFDAELDDERAQRLRDMNQLNAQSAMDNQQRQAEVVRKDAELQASKSELEQLRRDLEHERTVNKELQNNLAVSSTNSMTLESSIRALKARIEFLESGNKEQSDAFARLDQELREALEETQATQEKLRKEETLRRKLHNQVQELKGNIRVFCRVRPLLESDTVEDAATMQFPDSNADSREITVQGPEERSALGNITTKNHAFSFDHVFAPSSQNVHVFDEISQLVQSALDGYNVCIFCYGQTGSGKTHTMSSDDGMIPRAVHQIYDTAKSLEEKGWTYTMEGNFVEVYNENLNDLLGKADELDKKKHEIRHDMQKCKTTITDVTTVTLDSPARVETILRRAAANRSVAATKANERSSRSHSVFILKLIGKNSITGERSEGTLNLVDLAGSERLSHSGSTGERLKETQSINRSLSCLGDVIGALGQGKEGAHIPYRNSKLTYLLQFSLSGNSKTLMFVMVSPRLSHLGETLTSLKFATKVHNTHIGTAKRQARVRDS